jgi:hypothetical protein
MSAWPKVPELRHLAYINPNALWQFIALARQYAEEPRFWQIVHGDLMRQGSSSDFADEWVRGLRALAAGQYPSVKG